MCRLSLETINLSPTLCAQAVARGDAVTVGQAWQQVQAGKVQPDIDSLNTLLKCAPSPTPFLDLKNAFQLLGSFGAPALASNSCSSCIKLSKPIA